MADEIAALRQEVSQLTETVSNLVVIVEGLQEGMQLAARAMAQVDSDVQKIAKSVNRRTSASIILRPNGGH
jgi:ribosomal protein S11